MNGEQDPVEAALEAVEKQEAAKAAENVTKKVGQAQGTIDMLTSLGAQTQIVLHLSDREEARNSLEIGPADARVKVYYTDLADLKAKLRDAKEGKEEAARLGLAAVPKPARGA